MDMLGRIVFVKEGWYIGGGGGGTCLGREGSSGNDPKDGRLLLPSVLLLWLVGGGELLRS